MILDKKTRVLGEWIALATIFSFALWLRLRNLGALGIYGDADHTYFAVKGIIETGFPSMPSGMFYPRALLYSYLAAGSSVIFGLSEFSLRLPSVMFSLMTMAVLYVMLKEFFGFRIAFLTGMLFSISVWDIEVARHARMYEALLFFTLLSSWLFYKGFIKWDKSSRFLVPPLIVLATSIHSLGVFLVTLFACPFLLRNYTGPARGTVGVYGAITVIGCIGIMKFEESHYHRIMALMELIAIPKKAIESGIPADFSLLTRLISSADFVNIAGAMVLMSLVALSVTALRKITGSVAEKAWNWLEFGALMVTVIVQQLGVAFWMFGSILFACGKGIKAIASGKYAIFSLFLSGGLTFWIIWDLGQGFLAASNDSLFFMLKETVQTLFFYPWPTILLWIENFPIMTGIVLVGLVLQFDHASRCTDGKTLIVMIGFLGPLVAIGLFKEYPAFRYLYMVYPFFLTIYVWVIDKTCQLACHKLSEKWFLGLGREAGVLAMAVFLVLALSENHSLGKAFALSERTYSTPITHVPLFHYRTHPDHKGAGLFVKGQRRELDTVIAMDFISAAYASSVNYLLRVDPPTKHSIMLGAPFIRNLSSLQQILSQQHKGGHVVWLITSNELLGPHRLNGPGLSDEIMNFLSSNKDKIVFSSPDTVTEVYRFSPSTGPETKNVED